MGTILTVAGANFSANAVGYNAPNTRGLEGLFLLGGTAAQSSQNLAAGASAGSISGTPIVNSGYVSAGVGQCVFTGSISGNALTISSVAYGTPAAGMVIQGNGGAAGTTLASGSGTSWTTSGAAQTIASEVIVGSPLGYVQTGISDSPSATLIAAYRIPETISAGANGVIVLGNCGTYNSATAGLEVFSYTMTQAIGYVFVRPTAGGSMVNKTPAVALAGGNQWQMVALVVDNVNQITQMYNLSTGVTGSSVALAGTLASNVGTPIRLGNAPLANNTTYPNQVALAFAEIHNVALTSTELTAIYNAMKPVLAYRGISV